MSTAQKPTSKFMEAMKQVLANEQEITEKKKAKPDFLDLDKDGNKKESMKKAAKEANEEVELDEVNIMRPKSPAQMKKTQDARKSAALAKLAFKADQAKAAKEKAITKEEVELDEVSMELATKVQKARDNKGNAFRNKAGIMSHGSDAAKSAMDNAKKNWSKADKTKAIIADRMKKEEVELDEAATVLLRKGGSTKRMRYNPTTIARLKSEGWVVVSESFVDKVKTLFSIEEDISFEDAVALVEAEEVKRGRGRPKKAVDPNAAPKRAWTPGGRGRPPKNAAEKSTVSTSASKEAEPKEKEDDDAGDTGHILNNLRKAISTNGTNAFRQKNGEKTKVTRDSAIALLTHHDKLSKPSERFNMQQHISKSPEHLHAAIRNVNAGKPYNAGYEAKAKAKITLAGPAGK